ncbi:hypothetical protein, partial [Pseudomonas fragi]|uniref:hypothetical protein n=1 Tax=Pseudomonas fragi TaxID=296 RepID=UPI001F17C774
RSWWRICSFIEGLDKVEFLEDKRTQLTQLPIRLCAWLDEASVPGLYADGKAHSALFNSK